VHPRSRWVRLAAAAPALVTACAFLLCVPADVPPDVVWLPAGDGHVATSPGGAPGAWDFARPWLAPDDSYWEAIAVVPHRSAFARLRERIAQLVGVDASGDARLYWRCVPCNVDGPAAYAFTGLTESEATEIVVRSADARGVRERARSRIGAARFDALSAGQPDPGPAAR
jgi:hypothetical protein